MIFECNELYIYIFGFSFGFVASLLIFEINDTNINISKLLKEN
jgi:hypothetical protein